MGSSNNTGPFPGGAPGGVYIGDFPPLQYPSVPTSNPNIGVPGLLPPSGPIDPYGSYVTDTTFPMRLPNGAWPTILPKADCIVCKEKGVDITYTYQGPTITRRICKKCHTKALDKAFGVPINSELESVLYEQKEEKE